MFPLTRVPFWYRLFEPPPFATLCKLINSVGCREPLERLTEVKTTSLTKSELVDVLGSAKTSKERTNGRGMHVCYALSLSLSGMNA